MIRDDLIDNYMENYISRVYDWNQMNTLIIGGIDWSYYNMEYWI